MSDHTIQMRTKYDADTHWTHVADIIILLAHLRSNTVGPEEYDCCINVRGLVAIGPMPRTVTLDGLDFYVTHDPQDAVSGVPRVLHHHTQEGWVGSVPLNRAILDLAEAAETAGDPDKHEFYDKIPYFIACAHPSVTFHNGSTLTIQERRLTGDKWV